MLRQATGNVHRSLDERLSTLDLTSHPDYARFLRAHGFWPAVECWLEDRGIADLLSDWPEMRRAEALKDDFRAIGARPAPAKPWPPFAEPADDAGREAAVFGAAYVLQGARFGAAAIARRLPPRHDWPASFLSARPDLRLWRDFIDAMEQSAAVARHPETAIRWARAAFDAAEACAAALAIGGPAEPEASA